MDAVAAQTQSSRTQIHAYMADGQFSFAFDNPTEAVREAANIRKAAGMVVTLFLPPGSLVP